MAGRGRTIFEHEGSAPRKPSAPPAGPPPSPDRGAGVEPDASSDKVEEIGGPKGPEPTRYGDWEKGGRCSDF